MVDRNRVADLTSDEAFADKDKGLTALAQVAYGLALLNVGENPSSDDIREFVDDLLVNDFVRYIKDEVDEMMVEDGFSSL